MREQIKSAMSRAFGGIPIEQIPDDAQINKFQLWDSVGHLMLMLELENEFGVSIPTDSMLTLLSIDLIEAYLTPES